MQSLPGIKNAVIDGYDVVNLKGNIGIGIDLEIDPDYRIEDGPALITFLVESAWSVRDGYMPNATIQIGITGDQADNFDATVAASQANWTEVKAPQPQSEWDNGWSAVSVWLSDNSTRTQGSLNLDRLGSWPGEIPEVPHNAIVLRD